MCEIKHAKMFIRKKKLKSFYLLMADDYLEKKLYNLTALPRDIDLLSNKKNFNLQGGNNE